MTKIIKLSSLDKNAPPGVDVIIRLQVPPMRGNSGMRPPVVVKDYPAERIAEAQAHLNKDRGLAWVTWWRKDGRHVNKWPTMMHGKRRFFKVSVPFTRGVSDAKWKETIEKGVRAWAQAQGADPTDVRVSLDADRNRGEQTPLAELVEQVRAGLHPDAPEEAFAALEALAGRLAAAAPTGMQEVGQVMELHGPTGRDKYAEFSSGLQNLQVGTKLYTHST